MSGDVTYQALKRLAWLPERDALDNGSTIGGQQYDDVFFFGGTAENLDLVNCTISPSLRTTNATTINILVDDQTIILTSPSNIAATLPPTPSLNQVLNIKKYSMGGNLLNISGNGFQIDGNSSYVTSSDYAWIKLQFNSLFWSIMA